MSEGQLSLFSDTELAKLAPPTSTPTNGKNAKQKSPQAANKKATIPKTLTPVTEEPPNDRDRLVCYAGNQILFSKELSLKQIREQLEKDFPELSEERVVWHWDKEAATGKKDAEDKGDGNTAAQTGEDKTAQAAEEEAALTGEPPREAEENNSEVPPAAGEAEQAQNTSPEPIIVVPVVTAGKKGQESNIRGFHWNAIEALQDPRPVSVLAARDGLYEIRKTPAGIFSIRLQNAPFLETWREGFIFKLPLIPGWVLETTLEIFRRALPNEAVVEICWDEPNKEYRVIIPEQQATSNSVDYSHPLELQTPGGLIPVVCIHSHGRGGAFFSKDKDDKDEKATGFYAVMGEVHTATPQLVCRCSCGGEYHPIAPSALFEGLSA